MKTTNKSDATPEPANAKVRFNKKPSWHRFNYEAAADYLWNYSGNQQKIAKFFNFHLHHNCNGIAGIATRSLVALLIKHRKHQNSDCALGFLISDFAMEGYLAGYIAGRCKGISPVTSQE